MIQLFIFLLFTLITQTGESQPTDKQESVIEPEPIYFIVTPVLLRNSYNFESNHNLSRSWHEKPGWRFASSMILPGSGQAANRNWFRAGLYTTLEVVSIYLIIDYRDRGIKGERHYEQFADNNWSVVQYAEWLIEYHDFHSIQNPFISQLRSLLEGVNASFDPAKEWSQVNLNVLRNVERNTPYMTTDQLNAFNFSHVLPAYGSQQYYELIAKYYQYQAGWRDYSSFHDQLGHTNGLFSERFLIDRNGLYASPFFYTGVEMSRQFNSDFRRSRIFTQLLILNHFISAFDAYFTLSLKQNRLQATSTVNPGEQVVIRYTF